MSNERAETGRRELVDRDGAVLGELQDLPVGDSYRRNVDLGFNRSFRLVPTPEFQKHRLLFDRFRLSGFDHVGLKREIRENYRIREPDGREWRPMIFVLEIDLRGKVRGGPSLTG
ncbi:MAG TPA: hypothetical protein VFR33_08625 [Candidatus Dormibacteraeota bacterium]|nr:hypothetical protein [Candidatus Dormibacteraeota bacterium]